MGLDQMVELANTLDLNPVRFQIQTLRIWALVDIEVGGIDHVISGVGYTY